MELGACPKSMTYGPCGGVRPGGGCEVVDEPCPFVGRPLVEWADTELAPRAIELPRFLVDHRPTGDDRVDRQVLDDYAASGVAVLLGDHLDDPPAVDRVAAAERTVDAGVPTIATITGRDRSTDARAEMIDGLLAAGVAAVLCVTGDHPSARFTTHPDVTFVSEGTLLAGEVRSRGGRVAVAESPAAEPTHRRAARLVEKQRAGADIAVLNHSGPVADVVAFAEQASAIGCRLPMYAPVPVMTDLASMAALEQFPGLTIADDAVNSMHTSSDPFSTGLDLAVAMAGELLGSGSIAGVNLSGAATSGGAVERGRVMRRVVDAATA
jgi:5,10-methylenetetrahydrofolate reductase